MTPDWIILRTAGRKTISLSESLAKDGYEVWTPVETKIERAGPSRRRVEVRRAIMPSYVFAQSAHLIDLLQLAQMAVKPRRGAGLRDPAHADFSVMHWRDKIPMVRDQHLNELRRLQAQLTPRIKPPSKRMTADQPIQVGIGVRLRKSGFDGIRGTVERSDRRYTVVSINDRYSITLDTRLVDPDSLYETDISAALKAA